jgi:hypothetical protein
MPLYSGLREGVKEAKLALQRASVVERFFVGAVARLAPEGRPVKARVG